MKKAKKYIWPLIFPVAFLAFYVLIMIFLLFLDGKLNVFPHGSYAPAAWIVLLTLAWIIVLLPIYCIGYSKIIFEEKLNFLFSAYNSLTIILSHILPFNLQGETTIIALFVFWVLFCNFVPLICRVAFRKYKDKNIEDES